MTYCESYFGFQQVFADVSATIAEEFWQQIPECRWTVLEKLRMDTDIIYHENSNTGAWVIQGSMQQLTQAQRLLAAYVNTSESINAFNDGSSFSVSYMPAEFTTGPNTCINVNVISKPESEDKAVTCDIIKVDLHRPGRFGSLLQSSSTVAALTVKEKYKTQQKKAAKRRQTLLAANAQKQKLLTLTNEPVFSVGDTINVGTINVEVIHRNEESFKVNLSKHQVSLLDSNRVPPSNLENEEDKPRKLRRRKEGPEGFKFSCKRCSFQSNRESHLAKHIRIHEKVNTLYNCDKCNFTTIRLSHLRRHAITHSQTVYNCDFCTYKSNELKLLARHMKVKHANDEDMLVPEEVLGCSYCPYKTTKPYFYQRHLRVHCVDKKLTSIVAYQCDKCDYKTNRREHYIRHVNDVHTNRRPFLCDFCGKAFKRPDALKQHKQTHGEPVAEARSSHYKCNICQKKCRSHASLREHLAVHSNIRSFLCEICGASFKTRSVQRKHVITIHKNPRSYSCHRCEKRFNTNFALRRHLRLHQANNELRTGNQPAFSKDAPSTQVLRKGLRKGASDNPDIEVDEEYASSSEEDEDATGEAEANQDETNEIQVNLQDVNDDSEADIVKPSETVESTVLYIPASICDELLV